MVDVVAGLHELRHTKVTADKIVLRNTPEALVRRLRERSLNWDKLSGLLQRAILWDAGFVLTIEGTLAQIHVPCGKSMGQIFLSKDVFDDASCPILACNQKNLYFASPTCEIASVMQVTQCAIEDDVQVVSQSTLWSEDGAVEGVPDIRVYRYEPPSTNASSSSSSGIGSDPDVIFTINQEPTILRSRKDCPAKAFFTVPCTRRTRANAGDWCPPTRGGFADVWIDLEVGPIDKKSNSPHLSMAAMTMIVFAFALAIGCGLVWLYYRKRQGAAMARGMASTMVYTTAELPSMAGKSDEGFVTVLPLPARTNSYYTEFPMRRHDSDEDIPEVDMITEQGRHQEPEEFPSIRQDRELMKKRIPFASLRFLKLIARGANGEVWRGEYAGNAVAIKSLLHEKRHDKAAIELFAKEIRLASCLDHPNIVRFIGLSWQRVSELCSVSEFMPRGDLSDLMNSKQSGRLRWTEDKMCIAIDIASALAYLHSLVPLIIHRDLKSHNVLLNEALQAKLSDFGLSRERSFEETMTNGIGTMLWTAPEILRGEAYTEKADIFSYGIVLAELDTCLPPYSLNDEVRQLQLTSMQLMHLVTKGEITPRYRPDCPPALQELARRCVAVVPTDRPSAAELVFALRSHVLPTVLASAHQCRHG